HQIASADADERHRILHGKERAVLASMEVGAMLRLSSPHLLKILLAAAAGLRVSLEHRHRLADEFSARIAIHVGGGFITVENDPCGIQHRSEERRAGEECR